MTSIDSKRSGRISIEKPHQVVVSAPVIFVPLVPTPLSHSLESIEVIRETENRLQLLNKRWEKKKSKSGLWFRTKHEATLCAVSHTENRLSCARNDVTHFHGQLADARRLEREART